MVWGMDMENRVSKMEIFIMEPINIINSKDKDIMNGRMDPSIRVSLWTASDAGSDSGNQKKIHHTISMQDFT